MGFPCTIDMDSLSAQRKAILNGVLLTIPSKYPDDRFRLVVGDIDLDDIWDSKPSYSTCVEFPGYLGRCVGQSGWAGFRIRDVANQAGGWVEFDSGQLPQPGDIYALGYTPLTHVGVVLYACDEYWWTADFGQGLSKEGAAKQKPPVKPYQKSSYVKRKASGGSIMGEGGAKMEHIAGWLDIDVYFSNPYV